MRRNGGWHVERVVLDLRMHQRGALQVSNGSGGRGGRRRRLHQERQGQARQRCRMEQRNEDQCKQDGAVEGAGRNHPCAAAGADSASRFECGVFKHGLPPEVQFSRADREAFREGAGAGARGASACAARALPRRTAAATLRRQRLRPSEHPGQNHCACVDTGDSQSVPAVKDGCAIRGASLEFAP